MTGPAVFRATLIPRQVAGAVGSSARPGAAPRVAVTAQASRVDNSPSSASASAGESSRRPAFTSKGSAFTNKGTRYTPEQRTHWNTLSRSLETDTPVVKEHAALQVQDIKVLKWYEYSKLPANEKRRFGKIVLRHVPKTYTRADVFDRLLAAGVIHTSTHSIRDVIFPPPSCPRINSMTRPVFLNMPRPAAPTPLYSHHDTLRAIFKQLEGNPLFTHTSTFVDTQPLVPSKQDYGFYPAVTNAPAYMWQIMLIRKEERSFSFGKPRPGESVTEEIFHRDILMKFHEQSGRRVLLSGMPTGAPPWVLEGYLKDYKLDETTTSLIKLPGPVNRLVTDWLVVAKTVDEAYRIVKHFNMLPHIAPSGTRYMLTAEICW